MRPCVSTVGVHTWAATSMHHGFGVAASVYGYSKCIELPDGAVFAVYIHTGGHATRDAVIEAIWAIRLRVRPDSSGIELLPAPGR